MIVLYLVGLIIALFGLVWSARKSVDRMIGIARAYDVPDALIAMSIIAVGTSLPEICSHIIASAGILSGTLAYDVTSYSVIGGNMGSSTMQQFLFVGIILISFGSREYEKQFFRDTYIPMLAGFLLVFGLAYDGVIGHVDGGVLLIAFTVYMIVSYLCRDQDVDVKETASQTVKMDVLIALAGFMGVMISAFVSLKMVEILVSELGLNGSMAGVLSLGFAAALPEFSTVVESIRRENPYLGLGTVIGSNVVNPLVGIGGGGAISTYLVPKSLLYWDLPFKFFVGLLLLVWIYVIKNRRAGRAEGIIMVVCYFLYLSIRVMFFART